MESYQKGSNLPLKMLTEAAREEICKNVDTFSEYLQSIAWTYKYNACDQLLIYAQQPEARAVATILQWNRSVFRRLPNQGDRGIALLRENAQGNTSMICVYSEAQTYPLRGARPLTLWRAAPEAEKEIVRRAAHQLKLPSNYYTLAGMLGVACQKVVQEQYANYKGDKDLLAISALYMASVRCEKQMELQLPTEILPMLQESFWNTVKLISSTAQTCLRAVEVAVKSIENERRMENETNNRGKGGAELSRRDGQWDKGAGSKFVNGGYIWDESGQVWMDAQALSIRNTADKQRVDAVDRRMGATFAGDRSTRIQNGASANAADVDKRSGAGQANPTNRVDRTSERDNESRRGDYSTGTDLQLNLVSETDHLPISGKNITEEDVFAAIGRGSLSFGGKIRIYKFFSQNRSNKNDVEFLKKEYGVGGATMSFSAGAGMVEFDSKGMELKYFNSDVVLKLTWLKVAARIRLLINKGKYLSKQEQQEIEIQEHGQEDIDNNAAEPLSNRFRSYLYTVGDEVRVGGENFIVSDIKAGMVTIQNPDFPLEMRSMDSQTFEEALKEDKFNNWLPEENVSSQEFEKPASEEKELQQKPIMLIEVSQEQKELPTGNKTEEKPSHHPDVVVEHKNYRIQDSNIGGGTESQRYEHNLAALRLLKELGEEPATPEQQEILARYAGWGGISKAFEEADPRYQELKSILPEQEYSSARESVLNSFYTPPILIDTVYKILDNLGFQGGNVLDPGCGVGNFFGRLPENLKDKVRLFGVELDKTTAELAQKIYPEARIFAMGFERLNNMDNSYDVILGNVPFGDYGISDPRYNKYHWLVHDYFFGKSLDMVRAGGIVALLTSAGTMDKKSSNVRQYIANRAELLGAIRLPTSAFSNAGTAVNADLLVLQKRENIIESDDLWIGLAQSEIGTYNAYFVEHPEMIVGTMQMCSTQYGDKPMCVLDKGADYEQRLKMAANYIVGEITSPIVVDEEETDDIMRANPEVQNYSYTLADGKVYYRDGSVMRLCAWPTSAAEKTSLQEQRVRGMMKIRDTVRELIDLQVQNCSDEVLAEHQQKLNTLYDGYVKTHGLLNGVTNRKAFEKDCAYPLLAALENTETIDGKLVLKSKSDIFTKRTIRQNRVVDHCETAVEALSCSMSEKGRVDFEYMTALTRKTHSQLIDDLKGIIWPDPETKEYDGSPVWRTADDYLSGNIRQKLAAAQKAAAIEPTLYAANIAALEKAMPEPLSASDISVRLGATWIPEEYIQQFMVELLQPNMWQQKSLCVHYIETNDAWFINGKTSVSAGDTRATTIYGTKRMNAYAIVEQSLNLRSVKVVDYVEKGDKTVAVPNQQETIKARQKQALIESEFKNWIFAEPERRQALCDIYNERFNSVRPRTYDGQHLQFPGMNPLVELKEHQRAAVARVLYGGNSLLFHCVGAGKTYEMIASAMESKRLGLISKPLFVVPNHLVADFAAEYLKLYPQANVLYAREKDFEKANRKRFLSKIATGEWDGVIVGHSQFTRLPVSPAYHVKVIEAQMNELEDAIREQRKQKGDQRNTIKAMERSKKQLQKRLDDLLLHAEKDDTIFFEQLGIDKLYVDEAHEFKNLLLVTKMSNVAGVGNASSQKASDLYAKCRYMDELTGSRGIVFATGTPISNSMAEMYTMQRYLQYDLLQNAGLRSFDSWASTFGETASALELRPEGTGYHIKTRFSKFYNLPELMTMFRLCADIVTKEMVKLPVPKAEYHTEVVHSTNRQKEAVANLGERAEKVRSGYVEPYEDNMLAITSDGRKLALDMRLIDPYTALTECGEKIDCCVKNVFNIWQETRMEKSTQLIFCDQSTPSAKKILETVPHDDGTAVVAPHQFVNVYEEIRTHLINLGVPPEEIAFIHSANTNQKKQELYNQVRQGNVRVLLGSTQKMGTGMNVQNRMIALHHLDVPWRPADIEQREGRIIRQGNQNMMVGIWRYVTEGTFDAYSWQLIEQKQRFIDQITGATLARSCEDIDGTALSYAEVKALATGNPEVKAKMDLEIEVTQLRALKHQYLDERYRLQDAVDKNFPREIARLEEKQKNLLKDIEFVQMLPADFKIELQGIKYTEKKAAAAKLEQILKTVGKESMVQLGEYQSFQVWVVHDQWDLNIWRAQLRGQGTYLLDFGGNGQGNLQRLENAIKRLPELLENVKSSLDTTKKRCLDAKNELAKKWPNEEELKEKEIRLEELNQKLSYSTFEFATKKNYEMSDNEIEME